MRETIDRSSIIAGTDVYGSDQQHIGSVAEVGDNYLLVEKGLFFPKDLYVPFSAVTAATDDSVILNVTKGELDAQQWDQPPTGSVYDTSTTSASYDTGVTTDLGDRDRIRVHEEELEARKTPRKTGEVKVRKDVVEDAQSMEVPVTREEVRVRRVPVDRDATPDETAFRSEGDTLRVPVMEEEVEVTKRPRVVEEIEIDKVARQDTERVSDTVRRERVSVEGTGDARLDEEGDYRPDATTDRSFSKR
jgi:uncharacterized protein (TIGR02271 family)